MVISITPIQKIEDAKNALKAFEAEIPEIIFQGAKFAADEVKFRVQSRGEATNGSILMTPSSRPIGRYGQRHGKAREEAGLQVQKVDLYYEGQMWESWKVERQDNESGAGFDNDFARMKADNVQDNIYQTPIFQISEQEKRKAVEAMAELIKQKLRF